MKAPNIETFNKDDSHHKKKRNNVYIWKQFVLNATYARICSRLRLTSVKLYFATHEYIFNHNNTKKY